MPLGPEQGTTTPLDFVKAVLCHPYQQSNAMSSTDPFHDPFPLQSYEGWEPFDLEVLDTEAVNAADPTPVPDSSEPDDTARGTVDEDASNTRQQLQTDRLALLQLSSWEQEKSYNEHPPSCIHYSIEWKVTVNKWFRRIQSRIWCWHRHHTGSSSCSLN
jgi:hypothetical protein